jgi:HEAT repeat protein
VNVRARYHDALPATGARASRPRRPSPEQVRYVIFPLLERVAAEEPDLAATCLMGLARIAGPTAAGRALDRILAHLGDPGAKHREYDLLALGVLGHPGGLEPLRDVLLDRPAGRKLLGKSGPPPIAWRALAAIALGKGGAGSEDLIRALEREAGGNLDLRASCVAALGLAGRDPEHRGRVGAVLLRMLREEEGPATLRAQVPLALAQAMDRSSVAELLETVRRFRGPREVRQSCVVALGLLASDFGRDVVEALLVAARRDPDHAVRPLAVLAIAELAHRNATGPDEAGRTRLLEETALFFEDGISGFHRQDADRPWYALGAGLFARAHPRFADRLGRELSALARGDGDEDARAAATLALGLAPGNGHRKALRGLLDAASPKLRGAAIEAVGIAGDREAEPRLVALCQSPDDWIAHQAAIGLATLAGPRALPVLVAALERTSSEPVRAALTRAIGELGDKEVLPELARIALDRGLGLAARERALAALGLLGQDADRPWTADLRRAGNLAAATPTLQMVTALF